MSNNEEINVADLHKEWLDLEIRREDAVSRQAAIEQTLGVALGLGEHQTGAGVVEIAQSRRWNAELAELVLPPDVVAACQDKVLSSSKVKEIVPPALYRRCQKSSDKLTVKFK